MTPSVPHREWCRDQTVTVTTSRIASRVWLIHKCESCSAVALERVAQPQPHGGAA
jgi:hypothetical protein